MRRAYLFIDVQNCFFDWPDRDNLLPEPGTYLPRWEALLKEARGHSSDTLVAHVQHEEEGDYGFKHGTKGWQLKFDALDGERKLRKTTASVFDSNPDFAAELKAQGVDEVVIAGAQSEHCVQAATRSALKEGFGKVVLLSDAHHTLGETIEEANAISHRIDKELEGEGAHVVKWDQYQW